MRVYGRDLKVGDVIEIWWRAGRYRIVQLTPYSGVFQNDPDFAGARVARFSLRLSVTVFVTDVFEKEDV